MVTLLEASRALADQLGGFGLFAVTDALAPSDPDARRTLISTELLDEDRDPTSFNDYTVYAVGGALAGEQVAVRRDMFDGTNGILYTSGQFSAPPEVGQVFEYHARLPRKRHFGEPGLREISNQALQLLWFEDQLPQTPTASTRYAAPAWLSSNRQLVGVLEGGDAAFGVNPAPSGRGVSLVHDSTGRWMQLSSPAGGPFRVLTRRPHASWIKPAAAPDYVDSTAGLVEDGDETMADSEGLLVVSTWRAYRALSRRSPDFEQSAWRAEELLWQARAASYLQFGIEDTGSRLASTGGAGGSSWSKGWSPG